MLRQKIKRTAINGTVGFMTGMVGPYSYIGHQISQLLSETGDMFGLPKRITRVKEKREKIATGSNIIRNIASMQWKNGFTYSFTKVLGYSIAPYYLVRSFSSPWINPEEVLGSVITYGVLCLLSDHIYAGYFVPDKPEKSDSDDKNNGKLEEIVEDDGPDKKS